MSCDFVQRFRFFYSLLGRSFLFRMAGFRRGGETDIGYYRPRRGALVFWEVVIVLALFLFFSFIGFMYGLIFYLFIYIYIFFGGGVFILKGGITRPFPGAPGILCYAVQLGGLGWGCSLFFLFSILVEWDRCGRLGRFLGGRDTLGWISAFWGASLVTGGLNWGGQLDFRNFPDFNSVCMMMVVFSERRGVSRFVILAQLNLGGCFAQ